MVLRVLCPILSGAVAFAPHISLKLLLSGTLSLPTPLVYLPQTTHNPPAVVTTAEVASLSVNATEPDLVPAVAPVLAAAALASPNSWSCSAIASAWQRRVGTASRASTTAARLNRHTSHCLQPFSTFFLFAAPIYAYLLCQALPPTQPSRKWSKTHLGRGARLPSCIAPLVQCLRSS